MIRQVLISLFVNFLKINYSKNFFLKLEQGEIEIIINNILKKVITVGNGFGELALLSN